MVLATRRCVRFTSAGTKDAYGNVIAPPSQVRLTEVAKRVCQAYDVDSLTQLYGKVEADSSPRMRALGVMVVKELKVQRL